eukprot:15462493-Alexandrium_andersonii.AAC.1
MPSLAERALQLDLAAGRLEDAATAFAWALVAGRHIDDYTFVEALKEVEVMVGQFKDECAGSDKVEEEERVWCHRMAPLRR